jgi:hypothetical protein
MSSFEGFLERFETAGDRFVLRFVSGGLDPAPPHPAVFTVTVAFPTNPETTAKEIERVRSLDDWSYVSVPSQTQVHIQSDHGEELSVCGEAVTWLESQYEATDFERLARHSYAWGQEQHRSLSEHMRRIADLRTIIQEQQARVSVKASGHEIGSTARTLYEQQLSFLARLLRESAA